MSHYPTEHTYNDRGLECPGCGNVYEDSGDGEIQPHGNSIEDEIENFECENCGLIFNGHVEYTPHWTAEHPQSCDVKGYHTVVMQPSKNNPEYKGCLYCDVKLECDCEVWTYEKATEDNKLHGVMATTYIPMSDRRGHCKHQINEVKLLEEE